MLHTMWNFISVHVHLFMYCFFYVGAYAQTCFNECVYVNCLNSTPNSMCILRSGVLWTQKLKVHLLRIQSSKALSLKPGVGQYIAMHASPTARDFFLANSILPVRSPAFFFSPKLLPIFFSVLSLASTGFCVCPQNEIGHRAHYKQLRQVPVLSVRGI